MQSSYLKVLLCYCHHCVVTGMLLLQGKGGMKTFWLMGKKAAVGEKTVQSFLSFGGGSNPMVIDTQKDDTISNSTLGRIDLHLSGKAIPEEEEEGEQDNDESLNSWPIEENEIINLEKDSPVAYYGHVPHTPLTTNDDFRFQWHKDKVGLSVYLVRFENHCLLWTILYY